MFLANHFVMNTAPLREIYDGLMVLGYFVPVDNIVLALRTSERTR